HAQFAGELGIGPGRGVERERAFQTFEESLLPGGDQLFAKSGQALVEKRQSPTALVQGLRRGLVARLLVVALFAALEVQGKKRPAAAALESMVPFPFLGQKVLEGGQQECTEPAALPIGLLQVVLVKKAGEKRLGLVLGILRLRQASPRVSIERIPVE